MIIPDVNCIIPVLSDEETEKLIRSTKSMMYYWDYQGLCSNVRNLIINISLNEELIKDTMSSIRDVHEMDVIIYDIFLNSKPFNYIFRDKYELAESLIRYSISKSIFSLDSITNNTKIPYWEIELNYKKELASFISGDQLCVYRYLIERPDLRLEDDIL